MSTDCKCPHCQSMRTSRIDAVDAEIKRELMERLEPRRAVLQAGAILVAMLGGLILMAVNGYQHLMSEGLEGWKALLLMVTLVAMFHLLIAMFWPVMRKVWEEANRPGNYHQRWAIENWGHRYYCRDCGAIF